MSQIKAEISLRTNVKLIFHKNVGLQWYQWIPDFYNIRFWANLFNGKKLCRLKSYVIKIRESIDIIVILHFYEKSTSRWYERLISALIWDIFGLWNRSDGRDYREKRIVISRFLAPYIYLVVTMYGQHLILTIF